MKQTLFKGHRRLEISKPYKDTYCVAWYENNTLKNAVNGITEEQVREYKEMFNRNLL